VLSERRDKIDLQYSRSVECEVPKTRRLTADETVKVSTVSLLVGKRSIALPSNAAINLAELCTISQAI
jgi:hypothetical protein